MGGVVFGSLWMVSFRKIVGGGTLPLQLRWSVYIRLNSRHTEVVTEMGVGDDLI